MSTRSAQPNVPGRGILASYGLRFWWLVAVIGVAAGLAGVVLMELLRAVQHLAWNYHGGHGIEPPTFLAAVENSSAARRVVVLVIGGIVAGGGALLLARRPGPGEVSEAIWLRNARLPLLGSLLRGVHSIVIVGLGASVGREAAPQQAGAAVASTLSERARLPDWQRRLLVACGAGAGMAAVYNVPLGGALFSLEVLLGALTLPLVVPALASALIATAVAWIALPTRPTYIIPSYGLHASQIVWAAVIGPIAGLATIAYIRLIARAHAVRPSGRGRLLAPIVVFAALGVLAIPYPELLGNGRNLVEVTMLGGVGASLAAVLLVLRPLATGGCLGSGAPGGLFTPTLAFGVLLGSLLGRGWLEIWPGGAVGAYAVIGGAAVLAAAMQAPLAAIVLLLELTHGPYDLMVPMLLAVVEATLLVRLARMPSIYSARLAAGRVPAAARRPHAGQGTVIERLLQAPSHLLPAPGRGERSGER